MTPRIAISLCLCVLGMACGRLRFEPLTEDEGDASLVDASVLDARPVSMEAGPAFADDARIDSAQTDAATACAPGLTGPTCSDCVRYVDGQNRSAQQDGLSWQSAISDPIQGEVAASNAAAALGNDGRCQLWVRAGRYYVYLDHPVNTIPLAHNVLLYGGFAGDERALAQRDVAAHPTVLDARDPTGTLHVWHPLASSSGGYIEGFVVSGGRANGSGPHANGGGMTITGGQVRLVNMTFTDNATGGLGGAIHVENASLIVESSSFEGNQADGSGGAIALGGGGASLTLRDVDLRNNVAGGRGGAIDVELTATGSTVSLENTVLASNVSGGGGGGALLRNVSCTIVASTFADNRAGSLATALDVAGGTCSLSNSIVWNPSALPELSGLTSVRYSVVRGGAAGEGNLALDPQFVAYPSDLHLSAASPAIDAADGCTGPARDRDGASRVRVTAPASSVASDIGAFEYQLGTPSGSFASLCP